MTRSAALWFSLIVAAAVPAVAGAGGGQGSLTITEIGGFSAQASTNHAQAGVHIAAHRTTPSYRDSSTHMVDATVPSAPAQQIHTLPSNSALLKNPHPFGSGTLWYQGSPGQQCVYSPSTSVLCFTVVQPNGVRLDPAAVAAQVGRSIDLALSPIEASPSANQRGLTGDRSWFWLAAAPSRVEMTVRLDAEAVTVTADPSATAWDFGDGSGRAGGPGVAYQAGPPPADAITHMYETRCLPGDQGRDPYVSSSCASDGYHVLARVSWTISFTATGPVAGSGGLPARTTESELGYPVSEARAFLVGGSG
jgi:hypothetical protein